MLASGLLSHSLVYEMFILSRITYKKYLSPHLSILVTKSCLIKTFDCLATVIILPEMHRWRSTKMCI